MRFDVTVSEAQMPWRWMTWGNLTRGFSAFFGRKKLLSSASIKNGTLDLGIRIAPSAYRIQVTAIKIGDVRSLRPAEQTIIVRPRWFQTIWAGLALGGLGFFGLFKLLAWRARFSKLKEETAIMQLQSLRAQMNPHFIGNSSSKSTIENT